MKIVQYIKSILRRIPYYLISPIFRFLYYPQKGLVVCISNSFKSYSCNPKYITEYILKNVPDEYDVYWVFKNGYPMTDLPLGVNRIKLHSFKYFKIIHKANFIISNSRLDKFELCLRKHRNQKYVMTWHASMSLKRIEKDVEDILPYTYIKRAKYDSSICDLMVSGCSFHTKLFKTSFWYNGEIAEYGTPRCDVLFHNADRVRCKIFKKYNINNSAKILLYAPTFRSDYSIDNYKLKWEDVIKLLNTKYNDIIVFLRLHPNFLKHNNINLSQYESKNVIDMTFYPDMQELLSVASFLITDYSSCMFDMSLLKRPVFLYAKDLDKYDRGFYFSINSLPYPLAQTNEELLDNISSFDHALYIKRLEEFYIEKIGNHEDGLACQRLIAWMQKSMDEV